jgi:DNA primase
MSIQGEKKKKLTTENILNKITEYDIFKHYMVNSWKINVVTNSPFRKDDNPSFLISNRQGSLHFIDFADPDKRGDCFKFVQKLHHCDFYTSLKIIDRDFGLGFFKETNTGNYKIITSEYKQPENSSKKYTIIQVVTRKFNNDELSYWNQYHQSLEDLKENNVYAIKEVYLNKKKFTLKETELRFGYFYDGNWKIYRPFIDPKWKWVPNNVPITAIDGNIVLSDKPLIINKSKKDYMVIKKLYENCTAVQNEGIACFSQENVELFKSNSPKQILAFDSDPTGVKNSKEITKIFGFEYLNVPRNYLSDGIKDFADLAKDYGMNTLEKILKKKLLL